MISEIGGQIGWLASEMSFRFKKPVYPGETVRCHFTLTRMSEKGKAEAEAVFVATDGTVVLEAHLKGIVPGAREKEVMKAMVAEGDPTNKLKS
jgi:acyl dehydratase